MSHLTSHGLRILLYIAIPILYSARTLTKFDKKYVFSVTAHVQYEKTKVWFIIYVCSSSCNCSRVGLVARSLAFGAGGPGSILGSSIH